VVLGAELVDFLFFRDFSSLNTEPTDRWSKALSIALSQHASMFLLIRYLKMSFRFLKCLVEFCRPLQSNSVLLNIWL